MVTLITKPSISSQPLHEIGRMWGLNEAADEANRAPKYLSDWCEIDWDRMVTAWSDMWDKKENGHWKSWVRKILHMKWCWECLSDVEQWRKRGGDALKSMQLAEKLRKEDQKTGMRQKSIVDFVGSERMACSNIDVCLVGFSCSFREKIPVLSSVKVHLPTLAYTLDLYKYNRLNRLVRLPPPI